MPLSKSLFAQLRNGETFLIRDNKEIQEMAKEPSQLQFPVVLCHVISPTCHSCVMSCYPVNFGKDVEPKLRV